MEQRKISDFVTFVPGINPTRAEKRFGTTNITYYDQAAFECDFNHEEELIEKNILKDIGEGISVNVGDVVISNSMQLATIVGKNNAGKAPSLNFTKVEFVNDGLDKRYFIYLFNAYSGVKRQKGRELQGTGTILRIPIKSLVQLTIPIVPLEEQKKIGKAYSETLKLQSKLNKYTELMEEFVGSLLEENLKGRK